MDIWQALVLGTIQGLTEFFPISSSGHLIFIPKLFGWADQGLAFDVIVHLGTLVAVVLYFRHRLMLLIRTDQRLLLGYLLLSIIPAGLVGLFFGDWIEAHTRSAAVVAWSLIGWGIVLAAADRWSLKHKNDPTGHHPKGDIKTLKQISDISWREALFISCAQAIALIPGTSRSGITMTAGLFSRLDKTSAVEFSFLMAIPVIALAGAVKLIALGITGVVQLGPVPLIVGFLSAAASGLVAIWGVMKIITRWSFLPFVVYRVFVGVAILLFLN